MSLNVAASGPLGGPLALTIQQLTGLTFNSGAIVNFDGFRSVIDAVGVDMCVDEEVTSVHIGWNVRTGREGQPFRLIPPAFTQRAIPGMRPNVYHPGCQRFAGWQALDYVRQPELAAVAIATGTETVNATRLTITPAAGAPITGMRSNNATMIDVRRSCGGERG